MWELGTRTVVPVYKDSARDLYEDSHEKWLVFGGFVPLPPRAVAKLRRRLDHCASLAQVRAVVAVIADTLDPSDSESDADEARDEAGYRPD